MPVTVLTLESIRALFHTNILTSTEWKFCHTPNN